MSFLTPLFGTEQPIIGLVHLGPLPGDPLFPHDGDVQAVVNAAVADLEALQEAGLDGALVTNEFSLPYEPEVSPVTLAAIAHAYGALRSHATIPLGAEAIYDGLATVELCAAVGAPFTRCVFSGAYAGDLGVINRDVARSMRRRHELGSDGCKLFHFVTCEGERDLSGRTVPEVIQGVRANCLSDAVVVGADAPGHAPTPDLLRACREAAGPLPLVLGTGLSLATLPELLPLVDGAFVGTSIKEGGRIDAPVDPTRARALMDAVRAHRETH